MKIPSISVFLGVMLIFLSISNSALSAEDGANKNIDWGSYIRELQIKVKNQWHPPERKHSEQASIMLSIGKTGELLSTAIKVSSKDKKFDKSCIEALNAASPFNPLPEDYQKDKVNIEFTCSQHLAVKFLAPNIKWEGPKEKAPLYFQKTSIIKDE